MGRRRQGVSTGTLAGQRSQGAHSVRVARVPRRSTQLSRQEPRTSRVGLYGCADRQSVRIETQVVRRGGKGLRSGSHGANEGWIAGICSQETFIECIFTHHCWQPTNDTCHCCFLHKRSTPALGAAPSPPARTRRTLGRKKSPMIYPSDPSRCRFDVSSSQSARTLISAVFVLSPSEPTV